MTAVICVDLSLILDKSFLVGLSPLGMSNGETSTIHARTKKKRCGSLYSDLEGKILHKFSFVFTNECMNYMVVFLVVF